MTHKLTEHTYGGIHATLKNDDNFILVTRRENIDFANKKITLLTSRHEGVDFCEVEKEIKRLYEFTLCEVFTVFLYGNDYLEKCYRESKFFRVLRTDLMDFIRKDVEKYHQDLDIFLSEIFDKESIVEKCRLNIILPNYYVCPKDEESEYYMFPKEHIYNTFEDMGAIQ